MDTSKCIKCGAPDLKYKNVRRKDDGRLYDECKCSVCGAEYNLRYKYDTQSSIIYPKIKNFNDINLADFIHQPITMQLKRDGSNVGVYLNENGDLQIRSREYDVAVKHMYDSFLICECVPQITAYLKAHPDSIVFGELLIKGKSPARFELHEKTNFVVFDIHNGSRWLSPKEVETECGQYNMLMVFVLWHIYISSEESLIEVMDWFLRLYNKSEGIVVKNINGDSFKYKNEKPSHASKKEMKKLTTDILPDADIYTTIHKVLMDLKYDEQRNTSIAMPLIGRAIGIECKESGKRPPKRLFEYYNEILNEV